VGILGPRQIGKTTLSRQVGAAVEGAVHRFDLEYEPHLRRVEADPVLALEGLRGVVVLDEIQRCPRLFHLLRVLADRRPLPARFLILGSASRHLVNRSNESLAGRVSYYELAGLSLDEVGSAGLDRRWLRGGFPRSCLAASDAEAARWVADFLRTFVERDLPELGFRGPSVAMRRFWTMLAHRHGGIWRAESLARSLQVSAKTVRRRLDVLTDALVVRQLRPWYQNIAKRQVKAPKVYLRDSGLLHGLLGLPDREALESHPVVGASWEGLLLEAVVNALRLDEKELYFWATHGGAELDMLVVRGNHRLGIEIKRTSSPRVTRSLRIALRDLRLDEAVVVHAGRESYPLADRVRAVSVRQLDSLPGAAPRAPAVPAGTRRACIWLRP